MKEKKYKTDIYDYDLHNILVQTIDLTLYTSISKKQIIDVLRVRKLPRSFYELKMNRISTIESLVAKQLEYTHFDTIELKGVKSIDDKALTFLAKSKSLLDIGLTKLNEKQASILVKYHNAALVLSGLKYITIPVAKILANYKGNVLDLCAITNIKADPLNYLFENFKGDFLTIGNLALKHKLSE